MRRILVMLMVGMMPAILYGQTDGQIEAVLRVLGVMQIEDADPEEIERLQDIMRHPLDINQTGRASLEGCGLFTAFQIAALEDYRTRHGNVMSLTELAAIDGFSRSCAEGLAPFISFGNKYQTENMSGRFLHGELDVKSALKLTQGDEALWNYALRSKASFGDSWNISVSCARNYDDRRSFPSIYSGSLRWRHKSVSVFIGDYNARFGQGLCMWNTLTFSGLSSPSSFMRRPSGLSSSYSFTGNYAMTGLAADAVLGRWKLSGCLSVPDLRNYSFTGNPPALQPALNLTRYLKYGHVGLTHKLEFSDWLHDFRIPSMISSLDASLCIRGVNLFGEAAWDWVAVSPLVLSGVEANLWEHLSLAALVRYKPSSDEHGAAISVGFVNERHDAVFSADFLYHPSGKSTDVAALQLKTQVRWKWKMTECFFSEVRLTERARTWGAPFRTDLRLDVGCSRILWSISSRFDFLHCDGIGLLGYVEGSYKGTDNLKIYLRQGIFRIDDWDDRIYVYERDAPGSFNIPAYYGRGIWTSAYMSWRFSRKGSVYVRAAYISYPMMGEKKKPGKAELKLQYSLHF